MRDIDFNNYMKRFTNSYFVKKAGDGVAVIEGKFGNIAPYSPEKQLLGVWCIDLSARRKSSILKRLKPFLIEVHQDCENEFGAYFHERHLDDVCLVIKAKHRRRLSGEQRKRLADIARQNFSKKQGVVDQINGGTINGI